MIPASQPPFRLRRKRFPFRIAAGALLLVGAIWAMRQIPLAPVLTHVEKLGLLAPVAFVLVYAAFVQLLVPAAFFTLAGGALFGFAGGAACAIIAANIGANLSFILARKWGRNWLEPRLIKAGARIQSMDKALAASGWKFVAMARLTPLLPFGVTNYALGLTRVRQSSFAWGSLVGTLPATSAYVWMGHTLKRSALSNDGLSASAMFHCMAVWLALTAFLGSVAAVRHHSRRKKLRQAASVPTPAAPAVAASPAAE
jgi:uncharacterized membrane protein YdjX (TVP38/TMEM64 family)